MKYLLLTSCLFIACCVFGQEKVTYINNETRIKQLSEKLNNEDYDGVIELLKQVNENDSSYSSNLVTLTYYYALQEQHDSVIAIADKVLLSFPENENRSNFINNKATALIGKKEYQAAIDVLNEGVKSYPKKYLFQYNLGIAYEGLKNYKKAVEAFQESIIINPYHQTSHLKLGLLAYQEGKITKALMCFDFYLLLNLDGAGATKKLSTINTLLASKNNAEKPKSNLAFENDHDFDQVDLILDNHLALNKKYKISNKIKLAVVKQNHVFFEKLEKYKSKEEGFWDQKYLPFFQWVKQNNSFDQMAYTLSLATEYPTYKKEVSKRMYTIKAFVKTYYAGLGDYFGKNEELFRGKKQEVTYTYFDNKLQAIGLVDENDKMIGEWDVYNENGKVIGKGAFNDEFKKEGEWNWYYESGILKANEHYVSGELDGVLHYYQVNGRLDQVIHYNKGEVEGEYRAHNKAGALTYKKEFKAGVLEDFRSYYRIGEQYPEEIVPYNNGVVEGKVMNYYENGQLYGELNYSKDLKEGDGKKYYSNGALFSQSTYVADELSGFYEEFDINGTVTFNVNTKDGFFDGPAKEYYPDGTLSEERNYSNGKLDGAYKGYDIDGKLNYEFTYRNDHLIAYKFYTKEGKILKEGKKQKGEFYYEGYYPNENKKGEGLYDINGGKVGEWKFYDHNGTLKEKETYNDGVLEGALIRYYPNGEIKSQAEYKDGNIEGYYISYYTNKQMEEQGWYENDALVGKWLSYYPDGKLLSSHYYHKGLQHGDQKYYAADEKLMFVEHFEFGKHLFTTFYKSNGNRHEVINYDQDSSFTIVYHYENDKINAEFNYLYGVKHGDYKGYHFGGEKSAVGAYLNGEQHGEWIWYYENGKVKTKGTFVVGNKHGSWAYYHENGQKSKDELFEYGDETGLWKSYNENGIQTREYTYKYGEEHGPTKFFNDDGVLQLIRYYNMGQVIGYSYLDKTGQPVPMIPIENETGKIVSYYANGTKFTGDGIQKWMV